MKPWHIIPCSEIYEALKTSKNGLSDDVVRDRLKTYGLNQLPEKPAPKWWQIFLRQFHSPLIYILAIAAAVSLFIGEQTDAGFIALVLVINAAIGSYQEWKAEQSSRALQKILQIRASVQRDGEIKEISAEQIVPGDIVWLESGNRVPADIRLISAHGLEIDESLLSGESLPVLKDVEWNGDEKTPVSDRKNMTHAGSTVVRGRAQGVVVATGVQTAVGQLALDVMETTGGKPPLILRMERFSHVIAIVAGWLCREGHCNAVIKNEDIIISLRQQKVVTNET